MGKARMGAATRSWATWVAGCLLAWGLATPVWAAPTVAQMLSFRPKQEGLIYSTPTAQEQEACKVELVNGSRPGSSGWLLRDPEGRPLRRFFDADGDKNLDTWSYYLNGVEVYREIDSNQNKKIDQYRWLNSGGTKWGIDINEDGKIDTWKVISPEEVSQELLQAVISKDLARLQALMITDEEITALGLPAAEATRLSDLRKQAAAKFQGTLAKVTGLSAQTHWLRLEASQPQCLPADQTGAKVDVIKYPRAMVLYENSGKNDWLQTGEMIQVGSAWRLIDAPSTGDDPATTDASGSPMSPEMQKLLDELRQLDGSAPKVPDQTGPNPAVVKYNLQRAEVLLKIIAKAKADEREQWVRQLADCLSSAAQSSPETDRTAYERLVQLERQLVRDQPGSALAGYVAYREMQSDYSGKLAKSKDIMEVQKQWVELLGKFVDTYPKVDDAADALLQIGMVSEFLGKDIAAKNAYQQLVKGFADKKGLAEKAQGALRRLDLEGQTFELSGQMVGGGSFDIAKLKGKVVAVYYWATWNQSNVGDFARLKQLLTSYGSKGFEVVCVNLDNSPPEATGSDRAAPGVQMFHPQGLESPLATQYGIMVLPNMFLVGKDGKVVSRTVQMSTLEDELKKQLK